MSAMGPEGELLIRERLKRAKKEGDLPDGANPPELARYVSTIMQGMAVQAVGGAGPQGIARYRRHGAQRLA